MSKRNSGTLHHSLPIQQNFNILNLSQDNLQKQQLNKQISHIKDLYIYIYIYILFIIESEKNNFRFSRKNNCQPTSNSRLRINTYLLMILRVNWNYEIILKRLSRINQIRLSSNSRLNTKRFYTNYQRRTKNSNQSKSTSQNQKMKSLNSEKRLGCYAFQP